MEQPILILASLILIGLIAFILYYLKNEKIKTVLRKSEKAEMQQFLTKVQIQIRDSSFQVVDKFNELSKELHILQDNYLQKLNSGFDEILQENSNTKQDQKEKFDGLKSAFQEYSKKIQETLTKYSNDNNEFKKNTEQLKAQMNVGLQNILKEIQAPLDLN